MVVLCTVDFRTEYQVLSCARCSHMLARVAVAKYSLALLMKSSILCTMHMDTYRCIDRGALFMLVGLVTKYVAI